MHKKILALAIIVGIAGCSGETSDELYAEGVRKLHDGNASGAIVLFRNALEKDQNFLNARLQLARAYVLAGKYELAEKEFQKVKRLNPSQREIPLDMGRLYNALRKPELAIAQAREYLSIEPESAAALEIMGVAYDIRSMPREAEESFLRALRKEPGKTSTTLELAAHYATRGEAARARKLLEEVVRAEPRNVRAYHLLADLERSAGRNEQALALYAKLAEINTADPLPYYKAGLLKLEMGNVAAAEAAAADLLKRFPKSPEGNRLKGMVLYRRNNFPDAIAALQTANKLRPSVSGYYFLGLSHYHQGELENALSQFRLILDRVPTFIQARLMTGMILLKQKRLDDAVTELSRVVEADGKNAFARNLLGSAYMAKGMYSDGMRELDAATQLDPKLVESHLKKGLFHLSQGRTAEVEADLLTAVRVAPELLNTRLILCSFYMHRKNHAKALSVLKEGLSGKPEDAVLYTGMAKIMLTDNKTAEAVRYLRKAKEINPGSFDASFSLAAYYSARGDASAALGEYSEILRKDPANVGANVRMAALLELSGNDGEALNHYLKAAETRNPTAYQALASHYERKGDNSRALATLEEAARAVPRSAPIMEQKALLYLRDKQYKQALAVIEDIEAFAPERGISLRVGTYVAMQKLPEALKHAQRAIDRKPGSSQGYMLLASVHREQNNLEEAIAALKKGVALDNNPMAALMLANLYAGKGSFDRAMETCSDIVRKLPGFAPAYHAQGIFLEARGRKNEAVAKYRAALAIQDTFTPALNNLAMLCADGYGSREDALRLAESAMALEPANAAVMDTLGYALFRNNRNNEAIRILEKAEALLPGNSTINYHLALAHQASGENRQAVVRLRKALVKQDFAEAQQARSLLARLNP
ncbi:XrtA/PEP-CTERM system TPR-repeat protein PrsT [Geobacter sp. SVR]|uniref:XrtA/PEP-CTERM system TPR-repeat protein PrsT n=1 Tax=Geobacter sp. SVR TaxID=2495594 RepID=UPI00143F0103|nr:XrtA/PEP-CTERM system TPR-repeat protein PrsT [Geobacter sp. SVR]BCS54989.1 lipoprotein [Geobacter sp. SVR]GCF85171.1 lipoprotein [Geobacter sp. SVR]